MTVSRVIAFFTSPLGLLLLFAFFVRVAGIGYGLPLTVVADETPFTFAALKMLQLKTLIPALHPEAFQSILPYPPYLSYLLLLPFAVILGIQYLLWQGSAVLFQAHLVSDLSAFFMTARFVNVILGTLSVFLVYRIAQTLFRSRAVALSAGFLLATSILHIALSMVGRNWMPVSFVLVAILYVLTSRWSLGRRYLLAFAIAGFGMGISSLCALFSVFIGLYYLLFDMRDLRDIKRDLLSTISGSLVFVVLSVIPFLLYSRGGGVFLQGVTVLEQKSLAGLLASPWSALSLIAYSEPMLIGAFLLGLGMLFFSYRRLAALITLWTLFYMASFYILFRFDARFLVPLLPLFALAGGYAISKLWDRRTMVPILIVLLLPLTLALHVAYLAAIGDTREHAREWVLQNLTPQDKLLVFSSAMHIPTQKAAVEELRSIDAEAIRTIDEADETFDSKDVPYALNNLTFIKNPEFVRNLPSYAQERKYDHLLIEPRSLVLFPEMAEAFATITQDATIIARFDGLGDETSIYNSAFLEPFPIFFSGRWFGPDVILYELR